ncbi:uncharacterized protein LOC103961283 isoform X2 [Pyrus x bretschneideri]|uniref:uncharacterized protein LOC103961283 isoform X2 n=1 Tax=Pyrus x bretschneideri TaxID=225117 RepID=UPI00202E7520|nr:uncharacterized protein LOC103961283 isoform X2 [Pyrus x bretschneideri]XP_048447054.1 uncharacterized protein LOC103961283 isoform X2 [Pyrus x bretschneideri]
MGEGGMAGSNTTIHIKPSIHAAATKQTISELKHTHFFSETKSINHWNLDFLAAGSADVSENHPLFLLPLLPVHSSLTVCHKKESWIDCWSTWPFDF